VHVSFRKMFFGAALATLLAVPATAQIKVGVVDFARLLEGAPQFKVMQDALNTEFKPRFQQLENQALAFKTRQEKLQKDAATMTEDQRTKADRELRETARDLERRKGEIEEDANQRRNEEMQKLQKLLFEEVRTYAKAQSFDIVIAQGVIYATPTVDITAAVLQALQSHATRPAAAPAGAAPAPKPAPAKP
jgi:outer membrane protein